MPLVLKAVEESDFDDMAHFNDLEDDALVAPLLLAVWPADDERNAWSLKQQRDIFQTDSTAHFLKVVDTDRGNGKGEILSLARWHYYPEGYKHPEMTRLELRPNESESTGVPKGLNVGLLDAMLMPLILDRQNWIGNAPQWVLTTLVTRKSQRKQGAGGMLVKWGVDKAREAGTPAYLEATTEGKPLYEKFGFKEVKQIAVDLSKFGMSEPVVLSQMKAE